MGSQIKIKKNDSKPESKEVLAEAIIRIGDAMEKLRLSGLNEKAIIVLVNDYSKVPKRDIQLVLESLRRLKSWYCK